MFIRFFGIERAVLGEITDPRVWQRFERSEPRKENIEGKVYSHYGLKEAWLIRNLLNDFIIAKCL